MLVRVQIQQSAYLEALDQYIDYDEHGNIRKCLLDSKGNRLLDKVGNQKTLRHKFAVYCDDIAAGANTLEELYELFEALLCCCAKAGIQVKASKVKFGVEEITFHNYTMVCMLNTCELDEKPRKSSSQYSLVLPGVHGPEQK